MAGNRTVSDLRVKSAKVLEDVGMVLRNWQPPTTTHFVTGRRYKLEVVFGNDGPAVTYTDERYRKDAIALHIDSKGFKVGSTFDTQALPRFYTTESFLSAAPPVAGSTSQVIVTVPGSLDTNDPDREVAAYFRFNTPQVPLRAITTWYWRIGIYASVRNRVWRQSRSSI